MTTRILVALLVFNLLVVVTGLAVSCGPVKASSAPTVVKVLGPPGVDCFAFQSGDQVVGGSCIPSR